MAVSVIKGENELLLTGKITVPANGSAQIQYSIPQNMHVKGVIVGYLGNYNLPYIDSVNRHTLILQVTDSSLTIENTTTEWNNYVYYIKVALGY